VKYTLFNQIVEEKGYFRRKESGKKMRLARHRNYSRFLMKRNLKSQRRGSFRGAYENLVTDKQLREINEQVEELYEFINKRVDDNWIKARKKLKDE